MLHIYKHVNLVYWYVANFLNKACHVARVYKETIKCNNKNFKSPLKLYLYAIIVMIDILISNEINF